MSVETGEYRLVRTSESYLIARRVFSGKTTGGVTDGVVVYGTDPEDIKRKFCDMIDEAAALPELESSNPVGAIY